MIPISSKRRQKTNDEPLSFIGTKSKMMIEVITSNSHTQDVSNTTISSPTNQTPQCCSICNKNNARYKCPRCNISYCSVSCYQIHDGTSFNNNNKICSELLYKHHIPTNSIITNNTNDRIQSVLSNIHNEININLDKLDYRDEHISKLISKNEGDCGEIVNGMMDEIKDNVCKSNRVIN